MEIRVNGHTPSEAQELTKLPKILVAVINKVIFTKDDQLRIELEKLQKYLEYCIESYRAYYRVRSNKSQSQGGG